MSNFVQSKRAEQPSTRYNGENASRGFYIVRVSDRSKYVFKALHPLFQFVSLFDLIHHSWNIISS